MTHVWKGLLLSLLMASTAVAGPIELVANDGVKIAAIEQGKSERGVVLVHGDGSSAETWAELAGSLRDAGFRVVAVDLRGHGRTGGSVAEDAYPSMLQDVQAAVIHLRATGTPRVSLVGVDLGAVLALQTAGADEDIQNVIMISPRLAVNGVKVTSALAGYGSRPLMLVAGSKDITGVRAAGALAGKIEQAKLEVIKDGEEGMRLFGKSTQLEGQVIAWLDSRGATQGAARANAALTSGDTSRLETTGTRIGEAR